MLLLGSKLLNYPILSLQVGTEIARTDQPIIDPNNLQVIAYALSGHLLNRQTETTLMTEDVRELSPRGMIIDSVDNLVDPTDIIKLSKIIELNFSLIGLTVETKKGKKIGKVLDYTIDSTSFSIYQLIVKRPLFQSFNDPELTINRSQIIEVTDDRVIIKNDTETVKLEPLKVSDNFKSAYINPFRKTPLPADPTEAE